MIAIIVSGRVVIAFMPSSVSIPITTGANPPKIASEELTDTDTAVHLTFAGKTSAKKAALHE